MYCKIVQFYIYVVAHAPIELHLNKFIVCENLLGNKLDSDKSPSLYRLVLIILNILQYRS